MSEDPGNANDVASVPVNVRELFAVSVLLLAIVRVPVLAVMVRPLTLVAVATPSEGVTRAGDVARTTAPVPVFAVAAKPLMENELPVPAVSYVLFVNVSTESRLTTVPVPWNVNVVPLVPARVRELDAVSVFPLATVSEPVLPVIVRPLILVAVATPRTGVISVGVFASTTAPEPVVPFVRFAAEG